LNNKGYKYEHPSGVGGFDIAPTEQGIIGEPWQVTLNYKLFNPNTGTYTEESPTVGMTNITQEAKQSLINQLNNIRSENIKNQNIYYGRQ
jgi:hypothetical protein